MFSRSFTALALFSALLLFSCSGITGGADASRTLTELIGTSDTVSQTLAAIDTAEVTSLVESSDEVKAVFAKNVHDTLDLVFAEKLDAFLRANMYLKHFNEQRGKCEKANKAARERLVLLRKDIEQQAGDRSEYAVYIRKETAEMQQIRNHSVLLKRTFEASKAAIAQFQPEIGRFISRFVQPVTAP